MDTITILQNKLAENMSIIGTNNDEITDLQNSNTALALENTNIQNSITLLQSPAVAAAIDNAQPLQAQSDNIATP